jgi:hypothetical protein
MRRAKQTVLFEQWEMIGLRGLPFGDGGPDGPRGFASTSVVEPEPEPQDTNPSEVHHDR